MPRKKSILSKTQMDIGSGKKPASKQTQRQNKGRARKNTKQIFEELIQIIGKPVTKTPSFPDAIRDEDIVNLVNAKLWKYGKIEDYEISRSQLPPSVDEKRTKGSYVQNAGVLRGEKGIPLNKPAIKDKIVFVRSLLKAVFENLTEIVPSTEQVGGYKKGELPSSIDKYRMIMLSQKGNKVTPNLYHFGNMEDSNEQQQISLLKESGVIRSIPGKDASALMANFLVVPLGSADPKKVTVIILDKRD